MIAERITIDMAGSTCMIRPMPDLNNLNNSMIRLDCANPNGSIVVTNYFFYAIVNGNDKIVPFKCSKQVYTFLQATITGYYGSPDRQYISNDPVSSYFVDSLGNSHSFKDPDSSWEEKFDVVKYEPVYILDIKSPLVLTFDVSVETIFPGQENQRDLVRLSRVRLIEDVPLWTPAQPKEQILAMYEGLLSLQEVIEAEKIEISKKMPGALFDAEAKQKWHTYLTSKIS